MAQDSREQQPTVTLATDVFTVERRQLASHPEAVASAARIDDVDFYGNVTTWVIDLFRLEGKVTAFIQVGGPTGYQRLVIPPSVTALINRHQSSLVTKQRRRTAKRVVADKRAQGLPVGNPEALANARARKAKR